MKSIIWLVVLGLLAPGIVFGGVSAVRAQAGPELRIDDIQSGAFPQMVLQLSALDAQGYPIPGLASGNFTISEDSSPVTVFQVTETQQHPLQVVIAIDTTQSMQYGPKPHPLDGSRQAAAEFISSMGTADQVAVLAFGGQVQVLQPLTTDKAAAASALANLPEGSNTQLNDGLVQAVDLLSGLALRPVIIFVTDGSDSQVGQASFDESLRAVEQLRGVIFPIGWGGAKKADLEKLAGLTHGEAQYLGGGYPDAVALQAAFAQVQARLQTYRTQLQVTYQSTLPADGQEHQVAVGLDHLGVRVEQTRRFVATQGQIFLSMPTLSDGQTVGGRVLFAPVADSPAPLQKIDIQVDGQPLTTLASDPFTYEWDSTSVLPGAHVFNFQAVDTAGNQGALDLRLNVVEPLIVSILNPQGGAQVFGSVVISVQVDALAKIARVEFFVDDRSLGVLQDPPFEFTWPSVGAAEGGHEIRVVASDVNGFGAEDSLRVTTGGQGGGLLSGPMGIALAVALAAALLMVILVLRMRRQRKPAQSMSPAGDTSLPQPVALAGGARLLEVQGLNPGQVWNLPEGGEVSLGRKRDENDIPLQGAGASRRHAMIRLQDGRATLFNLRPDNPLYVNSSPVTQQHPLNAGDTIQAGESTFRFDLQA